MLFSFFTYFNFFFIRLVVIEYDWFFTPHEVNYFLASSSSFDINEYLFHSFFEYFLLFYTILALLYWVGIFSSLFKENYNCTGFFYNDRNVKYLLRCIVLNIFSDFFFLYKFFFLLLFYFICFSDVLTGYAGLGLKSFFNFFFFWLLFSFL